MAGTKLIGRAGDGDVLITVSNRRVRNGVAGQRSVLVDVHYEGPDWSEDCVNQFVHSTFGGPVISVLANGAQVFVRDAEQYGDTKKLDAKWLRAFYRCD